MVIGYLGKAAIGMDWRECNETEWRTGWLEGGALPEAEAKEEGSKHADIMSSTGSTIEEIGSSGTGAGQR